MASLISKNGTWYVVYGKNRTDVKNFSKRGVPQTRRSVRKKKFGIIDEKLNPFEEFSREYLEFSKANKAKESYRRDKASLQNLLRFFRSMYLPRITSHYIEQFKIKRLGEGVSSRTINIELRCMSHMLNKAVEWGYIRESPFKSIKLLRYNKKPPRF